MNILIIGLGSIAKEHINSIKELDPNPYFYALRSSMLSQKQDNVVDLYSIEEATSIKFDFAIVSNPTSEHKSTIIKILDFLCPLFIEKPLYHTLDVDDILIKAKKTGVITYIACNLRFLDCIKYVKDNIKNSNIGKLNEVNVYCGSYLPEWRKSDYRKSYSANPDLGGGVHIDLIHEIDYLYWIFGSPVNTTGVFKSRSSLNIKSIDYANYCLEYDNFCANIILNYYRRDYKRTFELLFENGTWLVDLYKNSIACNNETIFHAPQKIKDTYLCQMKYFINLLKTPSNDSSFNNIYDAYNVLKICLTDNCQIFTR